MKVAELSARLSNPNDVQTTLRQLSVLSQNSIARQVEDASLVLENCKYFCSVAAGDQQYAEVAAVLMFIHKANDDDGWLIKASEIIFPSLIKVYCLVLKTSDKKMSPRPGVTNMAISMAVQRNGEALRVLCCIYELCVDFCEVDWKATTKHLRTFAIAAAAVLFGSNYQEERDTLNDTEYAMDELARYSSFALSHILLTKPSLIGHASKILGKRITTLLTCLFSSPELSIQRSIILVVRLLYDNAKAADTVPPNLQRRIENGLSATHFGNGAGLELFKAFDVHSDDSETQGEQVLSKMLEDNDIDSICIGCPCTVQMRGKVNGRTKKGGSLKASVDWNKNSIVVHAKNQAPAYFPLYNISTMKWVAGHKEICLTFRADSGLKDTLLKIQFKPGNRGYVGRAIEQRIERILSLMAESEPSFHQVDGTEKDRKVSTVYNLGEPESLDENDDLPCNDAGDSEDVPQEDASHTPEELDGQDDDPDTHLRDSVKGNINQQAPTVDDSSPFLAQDRPTIFSEIAADGVLLQNHTGSQGGVARASQELDGTKEHSLESSLESDVMSVEKLCNAPHQSSVENKTMVPLETKQSHNAHQIASVEDSVEILDMNAPSQDHQGEDHIQEAVGSQPDKDMNEPENSPSASHTPSDPSDPSWKEVDMSDMSQDGGNDDADMQDVDVEVHEQLHATTPHAVKPKAKNLKVRSVAFEQQTMFKKKEAASSNANSEDSTVPSIHSNGSNVSKSSFCEEDESMRTKLLSVVREVMNVRQKKSSKRANDAKRKVQQIRAVRAREDRTLLVMFSGIVKKQAGIQRGKIATYRTQKTQLLSAAKESVVKLKSSLEDGLKKLRSLKTANKREIGSAKQEMKRIRDVLRQDLEGYIKVCLNRKNSRAKTDSLFQGLAKLLQDG